MIHKFILTDDVQVCLIYFAYQTHPDYPLIVAANRDEFYERPTSPLHQWQDQPDIHAGRDLKEGGTWMGVHRQGRFAAVTNYRTGSAQAAPKSRGRLVLEVLKAANPVDYINHDLADRAQEYGGFNALGFDGERLIYCSNHSTDFSRQLTPGHYGLSNGELNSNWPKIQGGLPLFRAATRTDIDEDGLWELLENRDLATDDRLPNTGVSLDIERMLSSRFIQSDSYGTRASTLMLWRSDGRVRMLERNFGPRGFLGGHSLELAVTRKPTPRRQTEVSQNPPSDSGGAA